MSVGKGVVWVRGEESVNGVRVVMRGGWDKGKGVRGWRGKWNIESERGLEEGWEDVLGFDEGK